MYGFMAMLTVVFFPVLPPDPTLKTAQPPALQKDAPARSLPAFHNLRFEEIWSGLGAAERRGWDALKNVPLDDSGRLRLTVGGQLRGRVEFWDGFGFASGSGARDAFGLLRARVHADWVLGPYVRWFTEGQSGVAQGRSLPGGNRTLDTDSAELQNAFAELRLARGDSALFAFRVGREELQFGRQRLVSPLDWSNTRPRSFDGFHGIARVRGWRIDGFWARFVRTRKYRFNPHDSGIDFYGLYASALIGVSKWAIDAYWLGLDVESSAFGRRRGAERRQTLGGRISGGGAGYDVDLEAAGQWGRHSDNDIRAWMLALEAGRRFGNWRLAPRVHAGFDYASGDADPVDQRLGTFNQLFPLGHAYLGYADFVGRQNVVDFSQGVGLKLSRNLSGNIAQHWFWRAEPGDALYNAGGGVVRAGPSAPRRIGAELDLTLNWKVNRHLAAESGFCRFFTGPFLTATGEDEDLSFGYLSLQWTF